MLRMIYTQSAHDIITCHYMYNALSCYSSKVVHVPKNANVEFKVSGYYNKDQHAERKLENG